MVVPIESIGLAYRKMPSLPPPSLVSWKTKYAICANASVTMMK